MGTVFDFLLGFVVLVFSVLALNYGNFRPLVRNLSKKSKASNIILLEDAMSSVTGFEAVSEQFISHCKGAGVQLGTCSSV